MLNFAITIAEIPLRVPFRIFDRTFNSTPVVVVTLREGAAYGRGEASGVYYLHDDPDAIVDTLECLRKPVEDGITRAELREILPAGGARNALDCALWELEAHRSGRAVWELANGYASRPLLTLFTLGVDDPAVTASAAVAYDARALKLKLDGNVDVDIERVRIVRRLRPDVWLAVDANQGYTPSTLDRLIPVLVENSVRLIEQPLARGRDEYLDGFDCPIPIAADESLQGLADLEQLVGRYKVTNVKLDKCGGLTEALMIAERARELGLKLMVGNMLGSSWAMAPAFVFGQRCNIVDLDGPIFLAHDRTPGVSYRDGYIECGSDVWGH